MDRSPIVFFPSLFLPWPFPAPVCFLGQKNTGSNNHVINFATRERFGVVRFGQRGAADEYKIRQRKGNATNRLHRYSRDFFVCSQYNDVTRSIVQSTNFYWL
jgi:hypothetical protein